VAVGLVSSLVILASLVIQLIMGDLADRFDKHRVLKWGTILNSIGWLVKIFVSTGFQIFVAGTYHSFAAIVMRTPLDALMYEQAADSGHYVDEYTVMREISLNIGRFVMMAAVALIFFFTGSIALTFLVAAAAGLAINAL
jgi:MFS family permease